MSDIKAYIEYIIKKHETLTTFLPIHAYINKINNINGSNNEIIWQHKKLIGKAENGEKLPSLEVVEVA